MAAAAAAGPLDTVTVSAGEAEEAEEAEDCVEEEPEAAFAR